MDRATDETSFQISKCFYFNKFEYLQEVISKWK